MKNETYNGWTNKETWLVNVWYLHDMPEYYAEMDIYHVEAYDLKDNIPGIAEECEALSQLRPGLLSDFISDAWSEVNWQELADHLNETLKEMEADNDH